MADTWRQAYAPRIRAIIDENKGKTPKEIKKILCDANPGQYGHMRKIWSDESLKQLGLKSREKPKKHLTPAALKNQGTLFN